MHKKQLTPEEKWENAGLENNFIFYKVMTEYPDKCKHLIEILLNRKIDKIVLRSEKVFQTTRDSHGIRLDVYGHNETECFNIEMQALNTKELPERARYYQGVLDVDNLKCGQKYESLKTSYIIFICMEDIFNMGYPIYKFENRCEANTDIKLNDRTYKYFLCVSNCDKIEDGKLKNFLYFLKSKNQTNDDFTDQLKQCVLNVKQDINSKEDFMEWEREKIYLREEAYSEGFESGVKDGYQEGKQQGIQEGIEEGIQKGIEKGITQGITQSSLNIAKKMLINKVPVEDIIKYTNLDEKIIQTLI